MAELAAMESRRRNTEPGQEIPERSWAYRLRKRYWFNDFGAYKELDAKMSQAASV